jgi:hypothetical protein
MTAVVLGRAQGVLGAACRLLEGEQLYERLPDRDDPPGSRGTIGFKNLSALDFVGSKLGDSLFV